MVRTEQALSSRQVLPFRRTSYSLSTLFQPFCSIIPRRNGDITTRGWAVGLIGVGIFMEFEGYGPRTLLYKTVETGVREEANPV